VGGACGTAGLERNRINAPTFANIFTHLPIVPNKILGENEENDFSVISSWK